MIFFFQRGSPFPELFDAEFPWRCDRWETYPLFVTPSSVPDKHPAMPVSFTALLFNTLSCARKESFTLPLNTTPATSLAQQPYSRRVPHIVSRHHFRLLDFCPVVIQSFFGFCSFIKMHFYPLDVGVYSLVQFSEFSREIPWGLIICL